MLVKLPEQLFQLPNLYFLNIEANPCEKIVQKFTLKGRANSFKLLDKEIPSDRLPCNNNY
jgi:hypothetical protein